jgi:hypothetical protein
VGEKAALMRSSYRRATTSRRKVLRLADVVGGVQCVQPLRRARLKAYRGVAAEANSTIGARPRVRR